MPPFICPTLLLFVANVLFFHPAYWFLTVLYSCFVIHLYTRNTLKWKLRQNVYEWNYIFYGSSKGPKGNNSWHLHLMTYRNKWKARADYSWPYNLNIKKEQINRREIYPKMLIDHLFTNLFFNSMLLEDRQLWLSITSFAFNMHELLWFLWKNKAVICFLLHNFWL